MCKARLLMFIFLLGLLNTVVAGDIELEGAWINEAPPTVTTLSAYVRIINNNNKSMVLNYISSEVFEKIEIHRTNINNSIASMELQPAVNIPAASSIDFMPGGLHLMLFRPAKILKEGDHVKLDFSFSDGTIASTEAKVRRPKQYGNHQHSH